jgi:hypothetical protein
MKDRIMRWWVYFRHGHGSYLTFLLSFTNFIVIQYYFLIETIPSLSFLFPHLLWFVLTFFLCYLPISVIVGWWDYKKGVVPTQSKIGSLASPWTRDLATALILICDGKNEEAKKILKKWKW